MAVKRDDFTVAWITDTDEAKELLEKNNILCKEPRDFLRSPNDTNAYSWGIIGDHNVVVVRPIDKSLSAKATVEALLASVPNIRFGLFVGCAAGFAKPTKDRDIRLGDVVVNQSVSACGGLVQYDIEAVQDQQTIGSESFLVKPPQILISALEKFCQNWRQQAEEVAENIRHNPPHAEGDWDRLFNPSYPHMGGPNCDRCDSNELVTRLLRSQNGPGVHAGLIASGKYLVRDVESRSKIEDYVGEPCFCFDTEAAGLMHNFPCLVIRGISRYADSHKNNHKWYYYASEVAATFAMMYLQSLPAVDVYTLTKVADSFGITSSPAWEEDNCKRCRNLQCSPGVNELRIVVPGTRFRGAKSDCHYCSILVELVTFLVEEWHYGNYYFVNLIDVLDQLELVVELERGKSLVAEVRKRTVPKIPGSPIVRADREDSGRERWMRTYPHRKDEEDDEVYDMEIQSFDMLDLLDLSNPITDSYSELKFDKGSDDPEQAPYLCMCRISSDPTGLQLPHVLRESALDYDIGSKESIDFIQDCINICEKQSGKSHHNCVPYVDSPLPTRVLDVRHGRVQLYETNGAIGQYCTLSYRWGPPEFNYKTTKDNLDRLCKEVPVDELPPLIRDAITVTRKLDVSYLWVDALCIIQEDERDWGMECPRMGSYYQDSYITICPSFAADVRSPFIKPKTPLKVQTLDDILEGRRKRHERDVRTFEAMTSSWEPPSYRPEPTLASFNVNTRDGTEIVLHALKPNTAEHSSIMAASPLAQRGWAWQENLLSRRIAHFTDWEIVFECRSKQRFEYTPDVDLKTGLARSFANFSSNPEASWKKYVSNFSDKALTKESDRLPAISGIAELISPGLKGPYLAGLWADWLDTDLLWYPDKLPSQIDYLDAPLAKSLGENPSWSWASMRTKVEFAVASKARESKIKLVGNTCRPAMNNAYGPVAAGSSLTVRGSIMRGKLQTNDAFQLNEYGLLLAPVFGESITYLQFRPDGVLQNKIIKGIPDRQTAQRTYNTLSAPDRVGGPNAPSGPSEVTEDYLNEQGETLAQDTEFGALIDGIVVQANKDPMRDPADYRFKQTVLTNSLLSIVMPRAMPYRFPPPRPKLNANVLCLLVEEQVAQDFPNPFTQQEQELFDVNLQYKDPHAVYSAGDLVGRTDNRPKSPGQPGLNQWYLVLGYDVEPALICWRVGILNLQLDKKIDLEEATITIT